MNVSTGRKFEKDIFKQAPGYWGVNVRDGNGMVYRYFYRTQTHAEKAKFSDVIGKRGRVA